MFLTTFFQMLSLALLILCGYYIGWKGMLDSHTMGQLSKVVNIIFNPMLIISSALSSSSPDKSTWFQVLIVAIFCFGFLMAISFPLAPFFDRRKGQKELYQLMFTFSNIGFMGIPLVQGVYGAEYTVYVLAFMMAFNLYFYTIGMTLLDGEFHLSSIKGMINPGIISGILALIIFVFNISLPSFLVQSIGYIGGLASPLAMISVGVTVAASDLKAIFTNKKTYLFTFVRMIVLPLLAMPVLKLLPMDPTLIGICLIEVAMPVGNLNLIAGTEKGLDCSNCSAGIIMTTLLSVITLPVLVVLL